MGSFVGTRRVPYPGQPPSSICQYLWQHSPHAGSTVAALSMLPMKRMRCLWETNSPAHELLHRTSLMFSRLEARVNISNPKSGGKQSAYLSSTSSHIEDGHTHTHTCTLLESHHHHPSQRWPSPNPSVSRDRRSSLGPASASWKLTPSCLQVPLAHPGQMGSLSGEILLDRQPMTTSPQILSGSRIPPGAWADTLLGLLLSQGVIVTAAKPLPGTNMALFAF